MNDVKLRKRCLAQLVGRDVWPWKLFGSLETFRLTCLFMLWKKAVTSRRFANHLTPSSGQMRAKQLFQAAAVCAAKVVDGGVWFDKLIRPDCEHKCLTSRDGERLKESEKL